MAKVNRRRCCSSRVAARPLPEHLGRRHSVSQHSVLEHSLRERFV